MSDFDKEVQMLRVINVVLTLLTVVVVAGAAIVGNMWGRSSMRHELNARERVTAVADGMPGGRFQLCRPMETK